MYSHGDQPQTTRTEPHLRQSERGWARLCVDNTSSGKTDRPVGHQRRPGLRCGLAVSAQLRWQHGDLQRVPAGTGAPVSVELAYSTVFDTGDDP